jgi:ribosomal-protein-alanine N-acetyltransferase
MRNFNPGYKNERRESNLLDSGFRRISTEGSMSRQPTLRTERLILRPLTLADAPAVQLLAGDRAVADTTLLIPHPYPEGAAEKFITGVTKDWADKKSAVFAITLQRTGELRGTIGLILEPKHARAEMGYWVGVPYWSQGICTEAAARLIQFGFEKLNLNKIQAHHFTRNPASGRVMVKIGMKHEGHFRQHVRKWDHFEDLECYAILREEYDQP